jgi:anthranilate 1,2-dioxygenase large subunit
MGGPAGFVSSEDGEAIELAHRATKAQPESVSLLEMGGTGPIPDRVTTRMNELALRGFWSYYSELMGTEPEAAIR